MNNFKCLAGFLLMPFLFTTTSVKAATPSASPTAPVIDSKDIANYGAVTGTVKWFAENSAAGKPKGQTFSTGDTGVMFKAVTYQVTADQKAEPTKTYVIRIGTVSGTTFTEIHNESATQSFTWNGGEYMTWTLATPVYLAPNTLYGVDVGMTSTTSGWPTGIPYLNKTDNVFPGGTFYDSGTGSGIGDNTVNTQTGDLIFHLDMDDPQAPDPFDGQIVSGGNVTLNWTNLPANVNSDVWVDVWFGTDPNTSFTKVVDAGQNVTSVVVNAPVADTYYWRVDSYLEGSATGTPVESTTFAFIVNDTDGDGMPDSFELAHTSPSSNTSLAPDNDEEGDGLTNLEEYLAGTNPTLADSDGDTLNDGDEVAGAGVRPATDPTEADTDGDGLSDGIESNTGTYVNAADTGTDPTNTDTDSDALSDGVETGTGTFVSATNTGTDPTDPDTDGDAAGDWYEVMATFTDPTDVNDDPGFAYPLPDPDPTDIGVTNQPVKIYIMSGQSNMVGIGYVNEPLNGNPGSLAGITKVDNKFPNFIDNAGDWTERKDVWYEGVISATAKKWLSAGCGASADRLGPELGFGHILGEHHSAPVILLKSSIGNRSLSWDYCPPGTPQFTWNDGTTDWTYAGYGDSPDRWVTGTTPVPINWYAGKQYDDCLQDEADWAPAGGTPVENVVDILDNFATKFPQYAAQGFEIAGYVWWQGHKDQSEPHASRYGPNMANFIKKTRDYYESRYPSNTSPDAPFVLGTVSFDGGWNNTSPGFLAVANGQLSVSGESGNYPEFAGNVLTIETRSYWREVADSPGVQGFHYNNNAETYTLVGDALGRGMVNLLNGNAPGLDTSPPTADPASFATAPTAVNSIAITMTATTGSDATDPVQYLFTETSGNPGGTSSSWQTSSTYTDTGLNPSTTYSYTVTMRDSASTPNVGTASAAANATTDAVDTDGPTPNVPTFTVAPTASGSSVSMTSVTGTDATGPVEYLFTETSGNLGGTNSGWQLSPSYSDNGLAPSTTYTYTITMRDSLGNLSMVSTGVNVTSAPEPAAGSDATTLVSVFNALRDHIDNTTTLTGPQIAAHKATIDAKSGFIGTHSSVISASFELVETYDTEIGAIFVQGSPIQTFSRSSTSDEDINWVIYSVMQHIMDNTYTLDNVLKYDYLFEGYKFGSSAFFPGAAAPASNSDLIYKVSIDASYPDTWGDDTLYSGTPARKPTGAYVAPGATAKITVPASIVGRGYSVRVGAHSWDFSNKPTIKRMDRVSRLYPINSTVIEVANPFGGGIYIEVPRLESIGVVEIQVRNAIRSPYFSAKSFHSTTLAEWQAIERSHPAPWADFQSDKFMMNVPTSWIYALDDPVTLMAEHDLAMDAINDLMGYPDGKGKEAVYPQVDLSLRASVFAPGYPQVNMSYNPNTDYGGNLNYFLLTDPGDAPDWYYHEEGHAYGNPRFGGESESNNNLLHVAVANGKFGVSLDTALAQSNGYQNNPHRTFDNTAIAWMTSFNFAPRNVPMASGEKSYQMKGHAKYVDIARLFGWDKLEDYYYSFNEELENGETNDLSNDGLMLRLAESTGVDVRPLLHFWGIQPANASTLATAIAAANLPESAAIYDALVYYKSIVPANNAAFQTFAMNWWGHQPNPTGFWTESEHGRQWDSTEWFVENNNNEQRPNGEIYVEASAADIQGYVDTLLALYFPTGRPGGGDFNTWIAGYPELGDQTDPEDDPDGDRLSNNLEAWLGTHPGQANQFITSLTSTATTVTFTHPQNATPPTDLTGYYEWSPNLSDWYASGSGPTGGMTVTFVPNTSGSIATVTATASEAFGRIFLRAGVNQN
ncbi:MAG: M60 family peptidase N-terminal accessory domain-containing protein [Akkermansiaceae bacterium]